MRDEILTHTEMCARERTMLQRGMYFRQPPAVSVALMSRRPGAPYVDSLSEDGSELAYEGHDAIRTSAIDPKQADQPSQLPSGSLTENGMFARAANEYKKSASSPALVRVYEKLRPGIWSDRGLFELVDYEYEPVGGRRVFRFKMRLTSEAGEPSVKVGVRSDAALSRVIPSSIKQEVYKRDKGQCVLCGAKDHLHFDHDYPHSKGGTSLIAENVRLLCARHNLEKAAKIQ